MLVNLDEPYSISKSVCCAYLEAMLPEPNKQNNTAKRTRCLGHALPYLKAFKAAWVVALVRKVGRGTTQNKLTFDQ